MDLCTEGRDNGSLITLPPRYELEPEPIGRGGFGVVYRARDHLTYRDVAIKVPFRPGDDDLGREVAVELQAAARLRHPAIIQVIDGGIAAGGEPYLVMEYADQGSMARLTESPPTWPVLVRLLDQVLAGLAHAHASELVHRDIKAENILLAAGENGALQPKIADFGLAKVLQRRGAWQSTRMGAGTLMYMPPEQFEQDTSAIHPGADLYAFGVLLYLLVAGRPPWKADGELPMLFAKVNRPAEPLRARAGYSVPDGVDWLVQGLLARDPTARYQLAADVRRDLANLEQRTATEPPRAMHSQPLSSSSVDAISPLTGPLLALEPPEDQRRASAPPTPGIVGFRAPHFVNRDQERAALWHAARDASLTAVGVAVTGAAGAGKSRLCQWLVEHLEEQGHARALHVRVERQGTAGEALRRGLRRFLHLGALRESALRTRLRACLVGRAHPAPDDALLLGRWLDPAGADTAPMASPAALAEVRLAVLERLLRTESHRGLVCVWIEDLGGGGAAEQLACNLLRDAHASRYPLLVLYEAPGGSQWTRGTDGENSFRVLPLEPLRQVHMAELLADLLPPGFALEQVVARSSGNPRVAVERARLEGARPGVWSGRGAPDDADGTADSPTVEEESPIGEDSTLAVADVARARLEAFFADSPRPERVQAMFAGLALLPEPCPPDLLARCMPRGGSPSLGVLVDFARADGLILCLPDGSLRYASQPIGDAARALFAGDDPQGRERRRTAAEALLTDGPSPRECAAAGQLLLEAGESARATDLLIDAGEALLPHDLEAAKAAFEVAANAADRRGLSAGDGTRARAALGAARCARNEGRVDDAVAQLDSLDVDGLEGEVRGWALEVRASLQLMRGQLDDAVATAEAATAAFQGASTDRGLVRAGAIRGEALLRRGDRAAAAKAFEQALELARRADAPLLQLDCRWRLSRAHRMQGELERARHGFERVLTDARDLGELRIAGLALRDLSTIANAQGRASAAAELLRESGACLERGGYRAEAAGMRLTLGEIARSAGRFAEARKEYAAALAVARAYRLLNTTVAALFNLGCVELATARSRRAGTRLAEIDLLLPAGTAHMYRRHIEVLRATISATEGRWEDAEEQLDELGTPATGLPADQDVLGLLEHLAEVSEDVLAVDALSLALQVAEAAGDEDAQGRLRQRLGGMG